MILHARSPWKPSKLCIQFIKGAIGIGPTLAGAKRGLGSRGFGRDGRKLRQKARPRWRLTGVGGESDGRDRALILPALALKIGGSYAIATWIGVGKLEDQSWLEGHLRDGGYFTWAEVVEAALT